MKPPQPAVVAGVSVIEGVRRVHDTKLQVLTQWLARGWALVPLHDVSSGACSCRYGTTCTSAGKHPLAVRGWQDESQLVRDPIVLQAIHDAHPEWNWGVATGRPSGMWVLDVDGAEGSASLAALAAGRESLNTLMLGPTGGGGRHLVFELPPDFEPRNSAGGLGKALDVRGWHGQIVVAPSISGKGPYGGVLIDAPVKRAPAWLEEMLRPQPVERVVEKASRAAVDQATIGDPRSFAYAKRAVDAELADLANAADGTRDIVSIKVALRLVEIGNAPWSGYSLDALEDAWTKVRMSIADHSRVAATLPAKWRRAVAQIGGRAAYLPPSALGGETIPMRDFIVTAAPYVPPIGESRTVPDVTGHRRVDLGPYLDGTYVPPEPSVGVARDDKHRLLYPGRWHTLVGLTGCGKTWLGLDHVRAEIWAGQSVVYLHFEESGPGGTLERLRALGVPGELLRERLVWLDCEVRWTADELRTEIAMLAVPPSLVVLDGINAACSQHGWPVDKTEAVGMYRQLFVAPFEALGAAVLSLGHPPKAKDRQDERHGFGSTAWLDEVDGVGFRLKAGAKPIRRGVAGSSGLYVVKDRYGRVEAGGTADGEGWTYVAQFVVDDSGDALSMEGHKLTVTKLAAPKEDEQDRPDAAPVFAREVLAAVKDAGRTLGTNDIKNVISGNGAAVGRAIAWLEVRKYIAITEAPRGGRHHHFVTCSPAFEDMSDAPVPSDSE